MDIDNLVGEVVGGVIALKMIQQISPQGKAKTRVVKVKIVKRKAAVKRKTSKRKAKK